MGEPAEGSVGALGPSAGTGGDDEEQGTHVTELPALVLGSILAHLEDPVDVMAAMCTCRLFWLLGRTTPFRLRLRHRQVDETPEPTSRVRVTPQTWTRAALGSIRTHMCATRELDLSGCFILDDDVTAIVTSLRTLERLILDNCQKLTSAVADVLAASAKFGPFSVSLQRCFGLRPSSTGNLIASSAAKGSRMRTLLLSHIDSLDIPQNVQQTRGESDLAKSFGTMSIGSGLRILALNNCARLGVSEFMDVARLCPHLELLFLGGSGRVEAMSQDTVASTASTIGGIIEVLPRLRVLELTFFASAVVHAVREQLRENLHIWDFSEESSVASALNGLSKGRWDSLTEDVAFGLRGAVNCSDVRKRTPLHVAAARGDVAMVAGLLEIGAVAVGMKDSSGSTALFVAAESGYGEACEVLLQGGADVLASNRAGETPLYIAALKGHCAAVGVMLAHCRERGVNWQDADGYGDGWTPLMAAAVADRRDVGEMLLEAAGLGPPLVALGPTVLADRLNDPDVAKDLDAGLRRLLNRQNRYGQTALHIAAQKGSVWFIETLLRAGASLDVPNDYGYRAVDVARRYKHTEIVRILTEWQSSRRKEAPGSGGKKSARKAQRNREKSAKAAAPELTLDCREADRIDVDDHNID